MLALPLPSPISSFKQSHPPLFVVQMRLAPTVVVSASMPTFSSTPITSSALSDSSLSFGRCSSLPSAAATHRPLLLTLLDPPPNSSLKHRHEHLLSSRRPPVRLVPARPRRRFASPLPRLIHLSPLRLNDTNQPSSPLHPAHETWVGGPCMDPPLPPPPAGQLLLRFYALGLVR